MERGKTTLPYSPLDPASQEIRLLLLAPGDEAESIDCVLIHAVLNDHPPYEALSYAWGNAKVAHPINVNGCTFLVTTNLEAALKRLRHPDDERYLWVDAICINQSDIPERNDQVTYMHCIYQCAERVIIWLGPQSDDSDAAIDQLEILTGENGDDYISQLKNAPRGTRRSPAEMTLWTPISHFFSRPWWTRVWVLQEVVWAAEMLVICGDRVLSWDKLLDAYLKVKSSVSDLRLQDSISLGLARSSSVWTLFLYRSLRERSLPISLEHTLTCVRVRYSTDPRDRVFGILNIMPIQEWPGRPDYSENVSDIFTGIAKHIITKTGKLTILCACEQAYYMGMRQDHLRKEYQLLPIAGLPTWVPDWSIPRLTVPLYGGYEYDDAMYSSSRHVQYHAAENSVADFRFSNGDRLLTVKGVCYDTIQHVLGPLVSRPVEVYQPKFFDHLESMVFQTSKASSVYREGITRQEAFWRSLTLDRTDEGNKATQEYAQEYLDWRSEHRKMMPPRRFLENVFKTCASRFLFTTSKGLMGFGPLETQPGDLIGVLLGCSVPIMLRKTNAHYLVDGDCCNIHQRVSTCLYLGCLETRAFQRIDQHYVIIGESCKCAHPLRVSTFASSQCACLLLNADVHGIMEGEIMRELEEGKVVLEDLELH